MRSALVLLSGGQDSTVALYWAKKKYARVKALCIHYGQRHQLEINSAQIVAGMADIVVEQLKLPGGILGGTSPLVDRGAQLGQYAGVDALPGGVEPTFIPGRNILFLAIAGNRAFCGGFEAVVIGVNSVDYGGYPDCREPFLFSMSDALNRGMDSDIKIEAPLLNLDKAGIVQLGIEVGATEALAYSHTCYAGTCPPCGKCHACILRADGFLKAGRTDPLIQRLQQEGAM